MSLVGTLTASPTTGSTATCNATLPAGAAVGDLLIAACTTNLGTATVTDDMGLSEWGDSVVTIGTTRQRLAVRTKVLTSADITQGTITWTWSASGKPCASGVVLRGVTLPSSSIATSQAVASSLTLPTAAAAADTVVIAAARTTAQPHPTIALPGVFAADVSNYAESATGACTALSIGVASSAATSGDATTSPAAECIGVTVIPTVAAATAALTVSAVAANPGSYVAVGAGTIPVCLSDGDDGTYAESPDAPTDAQLSGTLSGGLQAGLPTIAWRVSKSGTGAASGFCVLKDSSGTVIATTPTISPTATPTTYTYTLTASESTAFSNRANPTLTFHVTAV